MIALAPTKVFHLNPDQFIGMVRRNKTLAKKIMAVMKERLEKRKNEVLELMKYENIDQVNEAIKNFLESF